MTEEMQVVLMAQNNVAFSFRATCWDSPDHGFTHWQQVEKFGHSICEPDEVDLVSLFAYLHDTKRENEYEDPQHGLRAANFAIQFKDEVVSKEILTEAQFGLLLYAIEHHTDDQTSDVHSIGVCWDADRADLWRVGIEPNPRFFSTNKGKALCHPWKCYFDEHKFYSAEYRDCPTCGHPAAADYDMRRVEQFGKTAYYKAEDGWPDNGWTRSANFWIRKFITHRASIGGRPE